MRAALLVVCALSSSCLAAKAATFPTPDHSTDRSIVDCRFESAPLQSTATPPLLPDGGPALCGDAGMPPTCSVEWDAYPGRSHLTMTFPPFPGTCAAPSQVWVYVSFDRVGSEAALAAFDVARIERLDPVARTVTIYNGTEQDYFVRVVVE